MPKFNVKKLQGLGEELAKRMMFKPVLIKLELVYSVRFLRIKILRMILFI